VDFDIAMLDKYILPFIGIELPNSRIEVSKLYYDRKYDDAPPNTSIDLSFAAILKDLKIPPLAEHDAFNDALMTAMMYVALRDMKQREYAYPACARMLFSIRPAHKASEHLSRSSPPRDCSGSVLLAGRPDSDCVIHPVCRRSKTLGRVDWTSKSRGVAILGDRHSFLVS